MNTKNDTFLVTDNNLKIESTSMSILSDAVLAYCGYKIVNNQLVKSEYEPNPYKTIKCTK